MSKEKDYELHIEVNLRESFIVSAETEVEARNKFLINDTSYSGVLKEVKKSEHYDGFYIETVEEQ